MAKAAAIGLVLAELFVNGAGDGADRCETGVTVGGLGRATACYPAGDPQCVNVTRDLDGDYMYDSYDGTYEKWIDGDEEWYVLLSVGCPNNGEGGELCNTKAQNDMARGKWALSLNGNSHHFGFRELVAVCEEGCPEPLGERGGWPVEAPTPKWRILGGDVMAPVTFGCCARKAQECDACDEQGCKAHTAFWHWWPAPGLPLGCDKEASHCCHNNFDQLETGSCGCAPVPTECDHSSIAVQAAIGSMAGPDNSSSRLLI